LHLSRVSHRELDRDTVDVTRLVRSVAQDVERRFPQLRVELEVEEGLQLVGDQRLLRIVFENLLGNAWKFSSKTASPKVSVRAVVENGKPGCAVRDNGAGFEA